MHEVQSLLSNTHLAKGYMSISFMDFVVSHWFIFESFFNLSIQKHSLSQLILKTEIKPVTCPFGNPCLFLYHMAIFHFFSLHSSPIFKKIILQRKGRYGFYFSILIFQKKCMPGKLFPPLPSQHFLLIFLPLSWPLLPAFFLKSSEIMM